MIDILILLIVNAIFCNGIHLIFSQGHVFSSVKDKLEPHLPSWINKPLWSCVMCMASIWGVAFLIISANYHSFRIFEVLFYLPSLAFLNCVFFALKGVIEAIEAFANAKTFEVFNKK